MLTTTSPTSQTSSSTRMLLTTQSMASSSMSEYLTTPTVSQTPITQSTTSPTTLTSSSTQMLLTTQSIASSSMSEYLTTPTVSQTPITLKTSREPTVRSTAKIPTPTPKPSLTWTTLITSTSETPMNPLSSVHPTSLTTQSGMPALSSEGPSSSKGPSLSPSHSTMPGTVASPSTTKQSASSSTSQIISSRAQSTNPSTGQSTTGTSTSDVTASADSLSSVLQPTSPIQSSPKTSQQSATSARTTGISATLKSTRQVVSSTSEYSTSPSITQASSKADVPSSSSPPAFSSSPGHTRSMMSSTPTKTSAERTTRVGKVTRTPMRSTTMDTSSPVMSSSVAATPGFKTTSSVPRWTSSSSPRNVQSSTIRPTTLMSSSSMSSSTFIAPTLSSASVTPLTSSTPIREETSSKVTDTLSTLLKVSSTPIAAFSPTPGPTLSPNTKSTEHTTTLMKMSVGPTMHSKTIKPYSTLWSPLIWSTFISSTSGPLVTTTSTVRSTEETWKPTTTTVKSLTTQSRTKTLLSSSEEPWKPTPTTIKSPTAKTRQQSLLSSSEEPWKPTPSTVKSSTTQSRTQTLLSSSEEPLKPSPTTTKSPTTQSRTKTLASSSEEPSKPSPTTAKSPTTQSRQQTLLSSSEEPWKSTPITVKSSTTQSNSRTQILLSSSGQPWGPTPTTVKSTTTQSRRQTQFSSSEETWSPTPTTVKPSTIQSRKQTLSSSSTSTTLSPSYSTTSVTSASSSLTKLLEQSTTVSFRSTEQSTATSVFLRTSQLSLSSARTAKASTSQPTTETSTKVLKTSTSSVASMSPTEHPTTSGTLSRKSLSSQQQTVSLRSTETSATQKTTLQLSTGTSRPLETTSTLSFPTTAPLGQPSTAIGSTQQSTSHAPSTAKVATSTIKTCENDNKLNLEWPSTVPEGIIKLTGRCHHGIIMRECGMDGEWQTPDTTECRSRQAAELLEKANTTLTKLETMQQITPANVDMMGQLAEAMEDATNTSGGYIPTANDLQLYTNITSSLVRVFEMANETVSYTRLRRYAQSVVNVFSNMIAPPNREVWGTVSKFTQDSCGGCSCVMEQAEKLARSLARNLPTDGTFNTQTEIHSIRIHIELKKVSVSAQSVDLTFPRETSEFLGQIKPSPVSIPASVLRAGDSVKESSVYYIAYRDLQSCLPAITMGKYRGYTIQAQVVAAGVHPQPKAPFSQNVSIGHWHLTNEPNETACTWWDFETRNWTDRGCTVDPSMSNDSHTRCVCNHLTNFALLMSPFHKTSPIVSKALKYITIIGCGISFIFLFITAVAHLTLWRFVKKDSARAHIHVNLCISLAIGNLVIIISEIVDPGITVLCTVIAVFLHYFYLAAMTWMLCEGIQLYMSIVHVFRRSNKLVRRAYYAAGWGVPLVIVAITIGVTQAAGYGNQVAADGSPEAQIETNGTTEATNDGRVSNDNGEDKHCWLVVDNGVRWSFIGPAIFIIAVNLIIMVIVLKTMLGNRALQNAEQWTRTKAGVRASFVMLPLLGLSWLLGVFSINEQTSAAFGLLFAIVNSLQGLFVFIFHCLRSKTINDAIDKKNGRGGSSFRKSNLSKTISRQSSSDPRATMKRVKGSVLVRRLFPSKKDDRRRQYSGSGTNSLSVPSTPPKTRKEERKSSSDSGFSISSLVRKLRGSLSSENADESTSGDSGVADLNRSPDRSRRSSLSSTPHTPTTLTWAPTLDLEQPPVAPPRTKRQRASATLMPTPTLPTLIECSPYSTVNSITNVTTTAQVEPNQVDIDFTRPPSPENDPTSLIQPSAELVDEQHSNGNGLRRVASAPVKKHPKKKTRQSLRDTIVNIPEDASAEMETSDSPPEDDVSDYSSVFEELHEVAVRRRSLPKLEDWKNVL